MRKQFICVVIATLIVTLPASGQNSVALLQQALKANLDGGSFPQDVTILADQTDDRGATQPVRIQVKGKDRIRYEIGAGRSLRTTIFAAGAGWSIVNAKSQQLETHSALRRPTFLPFLDLIADVDRPRMEIAYQGFAPLGGVSAHKFTLTIRDSNPRQRMFGMALDESVQFFMDTTTLLILRSVRMRAAENDMNFRQPSVLEFSDYRKVGRFSVPFRIVNTIGTAALGLHQTTLVVRSVLFDQGLQDSLFLPN